MLQILVILAFIKPKSSRLTINQEEKENKKKKKERQKKKNETYRWFRTHKKFPVNQKKKKKTNLVK